MNSTRCLLSMEMSVWPDNRKWQIRTGAVKTAPVFCERYIHTLFDIFLKSSLRKGTNMIYYVYFAIAQRQSFRR